MAPTSVVLQLIPGNELSKLDPAIVTREFAAKRQDEILKRELMTMLAPIHVKTLDCFSAISSRMEHILQLKTARIHCGAAALPLSWRPDLAAKSTGYQLKDRVNLAL